jgi:hypothetical protein
MALYSSAVQQLYYILGRDRFIYVKNTYDKVLLNLVLRKLNPVKEFKPSIVQQEDNRLQLSLDLEDEAGLYQIIIENQIIDGVAINYDLNESDLTCYTPDELKTLISQSGIKYFNLLNEKNGNFAGVVYDLDHGIQYWKIFIFIALFFLLAEVAIIKFWDKFF